MAESSENQNRSSRNVSDDQTLYDRFQSSLSSSEITGGECSSSTKRKIRKTYKYPPKVRGFEYDEMSLEMMLLQDGHDDSIRTIGVAGLPGVGKTTLCKYILRNERVKASYPLMIWVRLSELENKPVEIAETTSDDIMECTYDELKLPVLLQTLNEQLKEKKYRLVVDGVVEGVREFRLEESSDDLKLPELLQTLNEQLKEKKYLLVVDDVGEGVREFRPEESSDELKLPEPLQTLKACFSNELPKEKGGAVIVISRSEKLIQQMIGDNNLHRLLPLSDPKSCWLIYKDAMDGSAAEDDPGASKDVMLKLMEKCGGLPVAAQMMGEIKAQKRPNHNSN